MDDNLSYDILNNTSGLPFTQDMGATVNASLTTSTGGVFKTSYNLPTGQLRILPAVGRFPFYYSVADSRPYYIPTTGTPTLVPLNNFFVYFIYALQDDKVGEAVRLRSAIITFTTLAQAQAYQWEQNVAASATLGDKEIRPLYKLIFETRNTYSTACISSALRQVDNLKAQRTATLSFSGSTVPSVNVALTTPLDSATNQDELNIYLYNNFLCMSFLFLILFCLYVTI